MPGCSRVLRWRKCSVPGGGWGEGDVQPGVPSWGFLGAFHTSSFLFISPNSTPQNLSVSVSLIFVSVCLSLSQPEDQEVGERGQVRSVLCLGSIPVPSACLLGDLPPHPPRPSAAPPPLPHRYGGFSLGGRDPGLPSGLEVGRSVEELRALLNPQLGGALDHILNNLTAWALGLDIQDGFKVGTGSGGLALLGVGLTPAR